MSSSPDDNSAGIHSPTSDSAALTNTTATSGFTAVNGRRSSSDFGAQANGNNGHLKMEAVVAQPQYDGETIRVGGPTARRSPSEDMNTSGLSSPGKRKRSDSEGRDPPAEQGVYAPADKRRTPPGWPDSSAQGLQRVPNHQTTYPAPDTDPKDASSWFAARQQRAESPSIDARLGEALQRENNQGLEVRQFRQSDTPSMDHVGGTPRHQITATTETTAAGVQVDPKKRKRVFSNRTKTGCQTCRKRKKKCDEGKPECSNCTRGGFVCEGYTSKAQWQKPLQGKSAPIALQSKESYGETGGLMPRPSRESYHMGSQTQISSDGQRARPIVVDEEHPRNSWGNSSWTDNATPSREYLPQRTGSLSFQTGTPLPDPSRSRSSYESRLNAQDHHMGMTAHGHILQQHVENLPNEMGKRNEELNSLPQIRNHGPPSAMASTAQLALQHSQHMTSSSPVPQSSLSHQMRNGRPMSEKDKMIAQQPYAPYHDQLVLEREACSGAVWRFNNSQNPSNGVSREERSRLFRQILEPQTGDVRRSANPLHTGRLGQGVVVEAPFNCSYGYNTKIGDNTIIARNCTIHDPVLVAIGARCKIGPNVDIYAGDFVDDNNVEQGVKGLELGKQVEIEDNVVIEGRCVIKAGVRIKTGSKILAGTVVDKNVPAHVIFGATGGEVIRGIWQNR